jgi:hypothetical protein
MPGIFISYRRDDSGGYAGRLFDVLAARFGADQTFMDLDDIQGGDDFAAVIEEKVAHCDALLAMVGERWLTITGADGSRRLDAASDFVRLEIAGALARGVRVVPVLVGGARMPGREELPASLAAFAGHQAVELRDASFHADADQLIAMLRKTVPGLRGSPPAAQWRRWTPAVAAVVIAAIAAVMLVFREKEPSAGGAADRSASTAPAAHVAGSWTGTVKYDWGDSHAEKFAFEFDGHELSGTASFLGYDRGILDGRVEGNRLSFTTKTITSLNDRSYEDTHQYKGVLEGDAIEFTMMTDSGAESHVPVRFTVKRSSP